MNVAVIGAGSWGTALAQILAEGGHDVRLWARRGELARTINEEHRNPDYLTDAALSAHIMATSDMGEALSGAGAVAVVTPSKYVRDTAQQMLGLIGYDTPIVLCMKGVEAGTGMLPIEVFRDELGPGKPLAVLSGPNHAEECVRFVPAATVVASDDTDVALFFQELFSSPAFRVYTSDDVLGVELCAAFKNVIAIAIGVSYGLGFGDNTAAMLMTRGQAEMSRLVAAAGGNPMTCMGLAGTGDLIATCMSRHSRNRTFGEALAGGEAIDHYEARTHMVVEGARACKTLATLSIRYDVELPITDVVRSLVWEGADPREAASMLAFRSLKPEFY